MTESTPITLSSPKRAEVSLEKLQSPLSLSGSFRESSEPKSKVLDLSCKSRKRKASSPLQKEIGGKKLKQTEKSRSQSLENALKGKVLSGDQLKKKKMLERVVSVGDGKQMSLSKYLHECGFSYESQSIMVTIKCVKKYLINYLVALFFRESENPLTDKSLDNGVLRRISNCWGVLQDIVKDTEPKITAEEATLSLLKNQGLAYESLIVFLDLFERRARSNKAGCESKIDAQNYEDIRYPLSETQFISDVLEISKGGYIGLKEFIKIFSRPSSNVASEWEKMKVYVWEGIDEKANLSEEVLLDHVRKCLKARGGGRNKQAFMDCLMNSDLEVEGKKWTLLNFLRSESGANLSTVDAISTIAKCIGTHGGSRNRYALMECLSEPELDLGGKKVSLYTFLKLEIGLSASDAIQLLAKCIGADGGGKNKQAFVECLSLAECDLKGETVFTFLNSKCGFSITETIDIIVKCIGTDGGCKNKQAFLECISKQEIVFNGERMSFFNFLISKKGGDVSLKEAICIISKCVSSHGGSKSKHALMECLSKPEIDLEGKKVSLSKFLVSSKGGALRVSEAMWMIVELVGNNGGSKNKQAFLECINRKDVVLNRKKVSLYEFLKSKQDGELGLLKPIRIIVRLLGSNGGAKNKQAFIECLNEPEISLNGERLPLYTFLCSKQGGEFSASGAIQVILRCLGLNGGSKCKQALMECISKPEIVCDGESVSLYHFLISKKGGALSIKEAMCILLKCVSAHGGAKSKQALIECFIKPEIDLDGKRVPLYTFLCSENGGAFSAPEAILVLVRCASSGGGAKNKQALVDCFTKSDVNLDGRKVSMYAFLISQKGGELSASEAIQVIAKCMGLDGGSKNKKAFLSFLRDLDFNLEGKKVSVYEFLKSGCGLNASEAIQVIVKCIASYGGGQNYQAFKDCFTKSKPYISEKNETIYELLKSKECGGLSSSEAIRDIMKVVGTNGGAKNKQAFIACLSKPDIKMNGELVSLYTFLTSKQGGGFNTSEAIQVITRCVGCTGGVSNKQVFKECFNKKLAGSCCNKNLYELFLSGRVTPKEAISLCLIFSINRYVLNIKSVLGLFDSKEDDKTAISVIGLLNSLGISCYTTLLNLVTKVLNDANAATKYKRRLFSLSCKSLVSIFLSEEGVFTQKTHENLSWSVPDLAGRCINACALYTGENINHELVQREKMVVYWIRSFTDGYQLTEKSLDVITSIQSLDDLKLLIVLCNREIEKGRKKDIDDTYCEACLMDGLQILIACKQPTIQAILKYESMLLSWFDLKYLSFLITTELRNIKTDKSIGYFFENRKEMASLLPSINLEKSFLIYMKLSNLTPFSLQPLKLEKVQSFFESLGKESVEGVIQKNSEEIYSSYPIYARLDELGKTSLLHEMMEGLPKIFMSYTQFQRRYLEEIQKTEDQKINPSNDKLEGGMASEFQKRSEDSKEAIGSEKKTRKRKGTSIEAEWEEPKKIRLFSRQDIYNLYEGVSRQERLTEKDCESFMQGASYLSETMLDVLTKKLLVEEFGNKEIQGKWQAFVTRYEKQKIEKVLEMIENLVVMQELGGAFSEEGDKECGGVAQQDDDLMSLTLGFEDKDSRSLTSETFSSLYDFCEEAFQMSSFEM